MSRDMQKLIDEYRELFPCNQNIGPRIGVADLQALAKISNNSYELIDNSLLAGIMIGYKYAMNKKHKAKR